MTSIPSGGSTSPRWDSRNQGFISPARLQQWKQQQQQQQQRPSHEFSPSPPPEKLPQSEEHLPAEKKSPAAPMSPPSSGHSRSLSAFSLFRIRSSNPEDISTSSPNKLQRPPPERRGSQNGFGKPVGTPQYGPVLPEKDVEPTNEAAPQSQASPVALSRFSSSSTASPMHPEIRSIVQLTLAHAHKIYFSGPLVKRVERQPDGQKPARDEGWRDVWAQLGGTTLSVWDMKAVEEASKQGKQVPPTYINVTDAFVNVLASVTVPETQLSPATKYSNVLTLNTAGSNLYLFACPASDALVSWTAALRLSAWEKSRLEEIYTAHLIRVTLSDDRRDIPTTLVHGRMEGWVRIRIAGQVDWKRAWMVVSAGGHTHDGSSVSSIDQSHRPGSPGSPGSSNGTRMKRMSNLFSRERSPPRPVKPIIQFLASPKSKDRKKPILTLRDITQAFAVYPERPELISRSTLIKLEGQLGDEEMGGAMKFRECWLMVLPELDGPNIQASEMLKWLIAVHDAFELYGRPGHYSWDPRDPRGMMFAYPIGPHKDMLFLDRELAEALDVRDERTSSIRSQLQNILAGRMQGGDVGPPREDRPPILPPLPDVRSNDLHEEEEPVEVPVQAQRQKSRDHLSLQLPPLSFETSVSDSEPPAVPEKRILTPITERSIPRRSLSTEKQTSNASRTFSSPPKVVESSQESGSMLGQTLVSSPTASSPPPENDIRGRRSEDSYVYVGPGSRPSSRLSRPEPGRLASKSSISYATTPPSAPPIKVPMSPESDTRSFTSVQAMSPQAPPPPTSASKPPAPVKDTPSRPTTPAALNAPSSAPSPPVVRAGDAPRPPSHATSNPPPASPPTRPPQSPRSDSDDLSHSAGAMYYMQQMDQEKRHVATGYQRHPPPPVSKSQSEDEETSSDDSHLYAPPPRMTASPMNVRHTSPPRPPASDRPLTSRRDTNRSVASSRSNLTASESATSATTSRSAMGRKPSGARAAPASKMPTRARQSFTPDRSPQDLDEVDGEDDMVDLRDDPPAVARAREALEDPNADALVALTFLEQGEETDVASQPNPSSPPAGSSSPPIPQVVEPPSSSSKSREYRSSFAPSRQAAERKAKAQAQQAAQQAAVSRPGRVNGTGRPRTASHGAWAESSEEEEEEEEEDEDADSDAEPPQRSMPSSGQQSAAGSIAPSNSGSVANPSNGGMSPARSTGDLSASAYPPARRLPRELPQLPEQGYQGNAEYLSPQPRRLMSDSYSAQQIPPPGGPRNIPSPGSNLRPHSEFPNHAAARQTIWSHVLESNKGQGASPPPGARDTFVQIEPPSQAMTKAFTPHGLLSAGLQDKQDRSAKRQEELARETGASLINVPNKPPPPQTGLLGAVTAHERERKREGGIGAALTERERERRSAEDRQRKLDDYQRQQLDQMQQAGSMYGGMGMPGFNPMMGSPMMMGMNPMMTGGWGYPGMMPGFAPQPQHMLAAQQAAMQAYQQAMMAFSTAGSQVGEAGPAPLNPMMTGGSMGMGGFDPRMSMMGMPMMSPSMGMNPAMSMSPSMGMNPGMGMNSGMGMNPGMGMGMNPMGMGMGMQMTGNSGFDSRPPQSMFDPGMQPPNHLGGIGSDQRPYSSQNSSADGQPAAPRLVNNANANEEPQRGRPGPSPAQG